MFHVKHSEPHILLVNPWITDFAAYNYWIRPLGLLRIGALLRQKGFGVTLIDCTNSVVRTKQYGDGKLPKAAIPKPEPLKSIPRKYSQYGIPEARFLNEIRSIEEPDAIAVTSSMTYWYPGVFKAINILKSVFKRSPVILGGIYATLCRDHAVKNSGADYVFAGGDTEGALRLVSDLIGKLPQSPSCVSKDPGNRFKANPDPFRKEICNPLSSFIRNNPYPAFDLYGRSDYITIATTEGCPYRCPYCASHFLSPRYVRRNPEEVVDEIQYWVDCHRIKNIAFYDDALLVQPGRHIELVLRELLRRRIDCQFHAPNGLHVREIDEGIGVLLFRAGFKTMRLGFETSDAARQAETGGKVDNSDFRRTVRNLRKAGYRNDDIGAYILTGLPGQRVGEVEESIRFVIDAGARPMLAEYSPIPHTPLFEKAKQFSIFDIENEPLYHNNSISPCQWEGFTRQGLQKLKQEVSEHNRRINSPS